jgi:hypothetical protein
MDIKTKNAVTWKNKGIVFKSIIKNSDNKINNIDNGSPSKREVSFTGIES